MKKYEITSETIDYGGIILRRVRALSSFGCVRAGWLGGWIEKEENLSQDGAAWVQHDAKVFGAARVYGDACVSNHACVSGETQVSEHARIYENAEVFESAKVSGEANVFGRAKVSGKASVYGEAKVFGDAWVSGSASVLCDDSGEANAEIGGNMTISGDAEVLIPEHAMEAGPIGRDGAFATFYRTWKGEVEVAFNGCVFDTDGFIAQMSEGTEGEKHGRVALAAVKLSKLLIDLG
jgi:carbonic anhydrase/acetyltransferase-like protein (isoleucine patch superfamily)